VSWKQNISTGINRIAKVIGILLAVIMFFAIKYEGIITALLYSIGIFVIVMILASILIYIIRGFLGD
jgi:hypothetical protein